MRVYSLLLHIESSSSSSSSFFLFLLSNFFMKLIHIFVHFFGVYSLVVTFLISSSFFLHFILHYFSSLFLCIFILYLFIIIILFNYFRGLATDPLKRLNMGLFSVRENVRRTVNVINVPKHDIWKLRTFEEAKDFLVRTFPQIDFSTFVTDEEIARFAALPGKQLPKPQYVKSAHQIFKNSNKGK